MLKFTPPQNMDPNLVLRFFWLFSGIESELKRNHYIIPDDDGFVKVNWARFRTKISRKLSPFEIPELNEAITYLNDHPPMKQEFQNGKLEWKPQERGEREGKAAFALRMVLSVRNNLFHGGKWPGVAVEQVERNAELLMASIQVLSACVSIENQMFSNFPYATPTTDVRNRSMEIPVVNRNP